MGVYVLDDYNVPGPTGHSVRLVWRGLPPRMGVGFAAALLPACVALAAAAVCLRMPGIGLRAPLILAASVPVYLILFAVLRGRGQRDVPTELTWEARDRELRIQFGTGVPLMTRSEIVPSDRIRHMEFEIGAEGCRELVVRCRILSDRLPIDLPMTIRGVDRRAQALDLALRIGAAMGFKGYVIRKCTPRVARVQLTRLAEAGGLSGVIPLRDDDPNYAHTAPGELPALPAYVVPAFRPELYLGPYRILSWEPGREVRIERPRPSVGALFAQTLPWALAGFTLSLLAASMRGKLPEQDPATDVGILFGACAVVALGLFLREWLRGRKTFVFDWAVREVRVDGFLAHRVTSFRDLRSVRLRGHSTAVTAAGTTRPWAWNWCELVLWTDDWPLVIPGPRYQGDADTPVDVMLPMAVDLARALGVPWSWQEYAIPPGTA